MSAPRLTFLYPHLFRRPLLFVESPTSLATSRVARRRAIHSTLRRPYEIQPTSSYTSADRAIPLPQPGNDSASLRAQDGSANRDNRRVRDKDGGEEDELEEEDAADENRDRSGEIIDVSPSGCREDDGMRFNASESHPAEPVMSTSLELSTRPLERVLHMEPPTAARADGRDKPPHLQAPPYVHHFDTYSLVRDLQNAGFSGQQSISVMKAVRGLLATNMQLAREGLVSKSDVENESYLFRAACSELKTEVMNSRRTASEKMRSERAHLQHEVDNLGQKVTQETTSLKDEIKGLFDDRKMAVRTEQRGMESKIQELNYKIQSVLTGQSKGEVEGLRWFLTRRAALFIGGLAVTVIVCIQYSVHMSHNLQNERRKMKELEKMDNNGQSSGNSLNPSPRPAQTPDSESTDALLLGMDTKTSQNFVSLG